MKNKVSTKSLKVFSVACGLFSCSTLLLALFEFIAFVQKSGSIGKDIIKVLLGAWYVLLMLFVCGAMLLFTLISSIFAYKNTYKQKQKKFLLIALPLHLIAIFLLFFPFIMISQANHTNFVEIIKAICWLNFGSGIVGIGLLITTCIFNSIMSKNK